MTTPPKGYRIVEVLFSEAELRSFRDSRTLGMPDSETIRRALKRSPKPQGYVKALRKQQEEDAARVEALANIVFQERDQP